MAIAKRSSRNIVVDDTTYRWVYGRGTSIGPWREPVAGELDTHWTQMGRPTKCYVQNVEIKITVELPNEPKSKLFGVVDGLVIETNIGYYLEKPLLPRQVRGLIKKGRHEGWKPDQKGDFRVRI
jgi:hypothetical protein